MEENKDRENIYTDKKQMITNIANNTFEVLEFDQVNNA